MSKFVLSDFLQAKLSEETDQAKFSDLPFRFAEVAKVLLDVYVLQDG